MDLDGLGVQLETFLLVGQKLLNIFTLVSLQLNHITHLSVVDDGSIAGCGTVTLAVVFCGYGGLGFVVGRAGDQRTQPNGEETYRTSS